MGLHSFKIQKDLPVEHHRRGVQAQWKRLQKAGCQSRCPCAYMRHPSNHTKVRQIGPTDLFHEASHADTLEFSVHENSLGSS